MTDLCSAAARPGSGRARTVGGAAAGAATGGELVASDLCSAAARPGSGRTGAVGGEAAGAATGGELVVVAVGAGRSSSVRAAATLSAVVKHDPVGYFLWEEQRAAASVNFLARSARTATAAPLCVQVAQSALSKFLPLSQKIIKGDLRFRKVLISSGIIPRCLRAASDINWGCR